MDIKKPDLKVVLAKLGGIRNHLNMLVPILIALVSIVPFVLGSIVGGKLNDRMADESLASARQLDTLARSAVSKAQVEIERDYQAQYAADVNAIEILTLQTTLRPLLSTQIFPKPTDSSQQVFANFGEQYMAGIENMVAAVNGRDCPSTEELGEHASGIGGGYGGMMEGYDSMMGMEGGEGYGATGGSTNKIVDAICTQRATSSSVYVNPLDVAGYSFWDSFVYETETQALEECWYWQVGYWIIEDVFDTVGVCNTGSKRVFDSPVKRIKFVGFNRPMGTLSMGGAGGEMMMEYMMSGEGSSTTGDHPRPHYVTGPENTLLATFTGRVSNEDYDVVHFGLTLIVDASQVLRVMEVLCSAKEHTFRGFKNDQPPQVFKRNQITVLESRARPIKQEVGEHRMYRYGDGAVVELNLVCEYIFDLNAYKSIVPEKVTSDLLGDGAEG